MRWRTEYNDLVASARHMIARRYVKGRHEIGAAILTKQEHTFSAVHVEGHVGRIAVCAEAVAVGMAAAAGDTDFEVVVAVSSSGEIVAPCGMCRELLSDYSPDCLVVLGEQRIFPISDLLPFKYSRPE